MYTYEEHAFSKRCHIIDPQGFIICNVDDKDQAEALLSHLNRGLT